MRLNRHFFIFLFTYLALNSVKAQTLYWVGGSGNFEDPKHWSLTSGGAAANQVPNSATDVVFDNQAGIGLIKIKFSDDVSVKSFYTQNTLNYIDFIGGEGTKLNVSGSFDHSLNNKFEYEGNIYFNSSSLSRHNVNLRAIKLKANVFFQAGNFSISSLNIVDGKKVSFENGNYKFKYASLRADELVIKGSKTSFKIDSASFRIYKKVVITDNPTFESNSFGFLAPFGDSSKVRIERSVNFGDRFKLGNANNITSAGQYSIYALTSCSGSCSATFSLVIDPANTGVYDLNVTNGSCPATAASISTTGLVPGSVFVVNNVCYCPGAPFNPFVIDPSTFEILSEVIVAGQTTPGNFNFQPPTIAVNPVFSVQPTCNLSCNGGMTLQVTGGTGPYTVTVSGPVPSTVITTGSGSAVFGLGNLCKGSYTLNAIDANGCVLFTPLVRNMGAPSLLVASPTTNSITCNGICSGAFSVSANNTGTSGYTVAFSNGFTTTTTGSGMVGISGLCTGPVSATVTDSKGCTATTATNIVQPASSLSATYSQTNLACNGVCIGVASTTASGGTPPYSYSWNGGPAGSTPSLTGLCAGTQTLNVIDANTCTTSAVRVFTITQPNPIAFTPTSITNVVCSGSCTGVASFPHIGGTGTFTYTWVRATGPSTVFTGSATSINTLCADAYTVFVKDGNNCPAVQMFTLTQPSPIVLSINVQSVTCFGASDGGATVTASGGNQAPFTYTWSTTSTNSFVTNVIAGNYTLAVKDASSCVASTVVSIPGPTAGLSANITGHGDMTCNFGNGSVCNGSISMNVSGGLPPYSYTVTAPSIGFFSTTMTPPFMGLCAGNYSTIVKDASGCSQLRTFTITQPGLITPTITITNPVTCNGSSMGGLTGSQLSSGGTPTYALTWLLPSGTSSVGSNLSNVPAGTYTFIVTDSRGCTANTTATLNQPPAMTITVANSNITCYAACNGVLSSTVTGGTPGYSYAWTNSLNVNVGTASTASNLCPGNYTLTITDAALCVKTATGIVTSPPPIDRTVAITPVNCFGDSNGSATVTASGGTPGYTFSFNSSPVVTNTTGIISGLPAGNYTATITDAAGCPRLRTFTITTPQALTAAISGTGSCNVCNGTATVTPSFGTSPYTVTWANSLGTSLPSNPILSGLCPAVYTATVKDDKNCTTVRTLTISQIIAITLNPTANSILCNGATTGSAAVTASGGVAPYTYSWSTTPVQTNSALANVGAGTYVVLVTDQTTPSNCSHTLAITLTEPPALTVTATQTNVTCYGYNNGAISSSVSGGTGTYKYAWSPGSYTTASISNLTAGVYTLTVLDGNLCSKVQTYSVTQPPAIVISHTATNPSGCVNPNGSICAEGSGGSGSGYTYSWTPGGFTGSCITNLNGGTYGIIVIDGAGCTNFLSTSLVNATGALLTSVSTSVSCFGTATGAATVYASGTGTFQFAWSPFVPSFSVSTATSGTTIATSLPSGTYVVTCIDDNSCVTNITIPIIQPSSVTINSAVTPAKCFASCDGSITVSPSGGSVGTPTYAFNWLPSTPPITGQGTRTVTNLCSTANPYTLQLTVGNNCITEYTFGIAHPPALMIAAVTQSLLCNNVCTGAITSTASGGTGNINYLWMPMNINTSSVTNLCAAGPANPYTLTATDNNNCSVVQTFTLAEPLPLTTTVNITNASCSNSCNATASVSVSGGTPTYTYAWSIGASAQPSLGMLCAGNYTSTVTDANGCVHINQFTVTPPAPLSVTLTATDPLCNAACNGSITTQVSGAQGSVSYSWSPSGSGQNPIGLCAMGNPVFTLIAKDQNSCEVTSYVVLNDPPALAAAVSFTNPLCNNGTDGMANVSLSNAVGAIQYTWVPTGPPVQTAPTATGLAPGAYTVNVKDGNSCAVSQTFTLTNPPSFTINTSVSPATCSFSNGVIELFPSGGTPGSPPAYSYTWTGLANTSYSLDNIAAGIYTIQIADPLGCDTTVTVLLSDANGPTNIHITTSSITCHGDCNGSVFIDKTTITGNSPFEVTWISPVPSTTVNPLANLCSGAYTAKIEDNLGCVAFASTVLAEPPVFTFTPTIGLPICPSICDGSITINSTGGIAPYSYSWTNVASTASSVTNLCADDYTLTVGYNNVCLTTTVISLPDQSSMTIVATVTDNICYTDCNGKASLSITGGTSPYNASWSNGQTGSSVDGLCTADYTVVITDNNGCVNTVTTEITSAPQIVSTAAVTSPSCGLCNGSASVSTSGGAGPYTYNWSTSATASNVANMCAGIYQVVISDALLCKHTETVTISNSNGITGELVNIQPLPCSGICAGAATVAAVGGISPISYNWINTVSTNSVVNNLCPGTYFVQMSDSAGCIRIASVTINPLLTLTVSPFVYLPMCGQNTGSISLVISGGTPGYNVTWDPPATGSTITQLDAGMYSYTVTESSTNSCSVSQSINLSNSNGPKIDVSQRNVDCYGACTGSLLAIATGPGPYTYQWSNGAIVPAITNLCKGVLTLTVTDGVCKGIESYTITDQPMMQLGLPNVQQPVCFGDCDGNITLVPNGGTLPYSFNWAHSSTANPVTMLCDGTYSATVTDAKGCFVRTPAFKIASASSISLAPTTFSSSCSSAADGSITVNVAGGIIEYAFAWNGPSGYTATTQDIYNIYVGSYSVHVVDDLGCSRDTVVVITPAINVETYAGKDPIMCPETGTVELNASASSGSSSYKWFSILDTTTVLSTAPTFTVGNLLGKATFILVGTSSLSTSCFDKDTISVDVYNPAFLDAGQDYLIPVYSSVTIGGFPTASSQSTLTWAPSMYLNDATSFNPVASNTINVTYTVNVTDENGCTASDTVRVLLYPELKVTSGFSPNNDGKNDTWIIDYIEQFPDNTVEIYNRWGDEIFSSKGYAVPFDGKYRGADLPVGTYYYIIKLNHPGYPKPITGPLTIFK